MERHNRIIQDALNWIGVLILITAMIFAFACVAAFAQDAPQGDQQAPPNQTQQAPVDSPQQPPADNAQQPAAQSEQPPDQPAQSASQPAAPADNQNSVARASFIRGDVAMQRGDSGTWSAVTLNTPLMSGDKISTGDASRAEVELDFANILRLDNNSQANLATLSSNRIQVQVAQGVTDYSVLKGAQADAEIDTPNVAVHPLGPGRFSVRILPDGDSEIIVREGDADISTSQGSTSVHKGQLITVHGMGTDAQYKISDAPPSDEFDSWNRNRDDIIYNANAYQHLNHYYTGAGDLDAYGTWTEIPDYGPVWIPNEPVGWAPYRMGSWVWEPYWGWTWSSYEPWGWAPYHYGRWFLHGNAWAWWPGPYFAAYRPIWAPAYVGFFGFGGGFGVGFGFGFGFGSIGWLPIGPGDFFHPWWGGFRGNFGALDITHGVAFRGGIAPLHLGTGYSNFNAMLASDRMRGGISSVAAGSFGRGAVASRAVSAADLRGSRMMTGNVPVAPTRESLRTNSLAVGSAGRASSQQHFFSTHAPAGRQESFSEAASRMQQSIQRGGDSRGFAAGGANGNAGIANRSGAVGGAAPAYRSPVQGGAAQGRAPNLEGQGSDVWHSFGSSRSESPSGAAEQPSYRASQPSGASRTFGAQGQSQSGWQRFSANGGGSSRPPLDMSKPIVNPRSSSGGSGPYGGGPSYRGGSSPAYRGGASPEYRGGSSSRPSYGGTSGGGYRSAPSPSYRGGGGRPSYSGGGSRSFGGGSGRSFGGGGGHSGGGHGGGGRR